MVYSIDVHYTEATIRSAAHRFLKRFLLPEIAVGLAAVVLGALMYGVNAAPLWVALTLGVAGLALVLASGAVALRYVSQARRKFAAMGDAHAVWRFSDAALGTKSGLGTTEIPWRLVTKVWRFDDVWLLFFDAGGYSTLPTAQLSPDVRDFIVRRVEASGGKVA